MADETRAKIPMVRLTITVLVIAGVVAAAAFGGYKWAGAGREDLAQWIPAMTGIATLMAAVVAAVYANRAFTLEAAREQRWTDTQRLEQASKVAAWVGSVYHPNLTLAYLPGRRETGFYLRNASDVPVTDVRLRLVIGDQGAGQVAVGVLPPLEEPEFVSFPPNSAAYDAAHPDAERDEQFRQLADPSIQLIGGDDFAELSFRDAAGQDWHRTAEGKLLSGKPGWARSGS